MIELGTGGHAATLPKATGWRSPRLRRVPTRPYGPRRRFHGAMGKSDVISKRSLTDQIDVRSDVSVIDDALSRRRVGGQRLRECTSSE
jgi:hypothetical protein